MAEDQPGKIRVLVVDDSSLMRRIITTALSKHPRIEVVGYAADGFQAIEAVNRLEPDVVTLDIEMPEMDGLTALREIRKTHKRMPIIMFSTLTHQGAQAAVVALTAGATDYVGKPSASAGSIDSAFKVLEQDLIPKLIGLGERALRRQSLDGAVKPSTVTAQPVARAPTPTVPVKSSPEPTAPSNRFDTVSAVAIGVSTGGPMALMELFGQLNQPLSVPVFIVQHMPPIFTALLAARLTAAGVMDVREPVSGEEAKAGTAYMAPGGFHMALSRVGTKLLITLNTDPPENSCRPAVDVLFRSAADIYGKALLGVVLTGMGQDGLKGAEYIKARQGQIIAQDEATSVIWGMPMAIVKNNLADAVLPLGKIMDEIVFRSRKVKSL
jgi:two-component system chemotaxis response regulator CheB